MGGIGAARAGAVAVLGATVAALAILGVRPLSAQDPDMNFFVALEGATWGEDQPALEVSDRHCRDLAYAAGLGDGTWRAYLDGKAEDGEAGEVARERIGSGPFVNFYGAVIADDVEHLHSDANNLSYRTASTADGGGPIPEGVLEIPAGSELDGSMFSRDGPFFCFRISG